MLGSLFREFWDVLGSVWEYFGDVFGWVWEGSEGVEKSRKPHFPKMYGSNFPASGVHKYVFLAYSRTKNTKKYKIQTCMHKTKILLI